MPLATDPRWSSRPQPRFGNTIAATGSALAVVGVLVLAGDQLGDDGEPFANGGGSAAPGVLLSALILAAGLLLVARSRTGPLATAGVVSAAVGVPSLLFFATWSSDEIVGSSSADIILGGSTLAWAALYFVGPWRARPLFLGLALVGLWLFTMKQVQGDFSFDPFGQGEGSPFGSSFSDLGAVSLGFGTVYLLVTFPLERRGYHGIATPFVPAGIVALVAGVALLSPDLEADGTGALLVALGTGLALVGAIGWQRRFSMWLGGIGVFVGASTLLGNNAHDSATALGIASIAVGIGVVALAYAVAQQWNEPPETEQGEWFPRRGRYRGGSTQPSVPPPEPAGAERG